MSKRPINTKILLTILIFAVAVIPTTAASFLYYFTEHRSLTEQAVNYEYQFLNDAWRNFSELSERMEKIQYEATSQFVTANMGTIEISHLKEGQIKSIRAMENLLQSIRRTNSGLHNIYIINTEGKKILYSSTYSYDQALLLSKPWVNSSYHTSQEWTMIPPHTPDYAAINYPQSDQSCLSFVTGLVDLNKDDSFEYILQIDINTDYLVSLVSSSQDQSQNLVAIYADSSLINAVHCTEEEQRILDHYQTLPQTGEPQVEELDSYLLSRITIPDLGIYLCKLSCPLAASGYHNLTIQLLLLILLSFLVAAVCAVWIAHLFITPFERLIQETMLGIENTSCLKKVSIECSNSDIFQIAEHFNILIDRINLLLERSVQHEKEKRKIQMRMLQAQISPHFLYNTLNSIKWMALIRGQEEIADTITSLVDLLEYCCRDTKSLTPLGEEIAFLQNYIRIQTSRNPDHKITVVYDTATVNQYGVLKLSLQPAVENAFLHAFSDTRRDPRIVITGHVQGQRLILQIIDNGVGFDTRIVNKNLTGIGIRNVDERIKLTFGNEFGQVIESHIGEGTTVTLTFPLMTP